MAESPFPLWAREMSPSGPRPTIGGLLSLVLAVLLAVMVWRAAAGAEAVPGPARAGPACASSNAWSTKASTRARATAGRCAPAAPSWLRPEAGSAAPRATPRCWTSRA
jgi:hypothetical protein